MNSANDIWNELKELNSPLADMSRAMPYEVPQGYFANLDKHLTDYSKWANMAEPVTAWPKATPYEVPQGYFEVFPAIVTNMATEPVLSFGKSNPHSVPEGYFDQLPQQILQKVKVVEKPKIISLTGSVWKNVRWAAAAILLLGVGAGLYSNYSTHKISFNPQTELATVSGDSLNAYVEQNIDEYELETLASSLETNDVKTLTSKLSDEEIKSYLDETGWEESTMNL